MQTTKLLLLGFFILMMAGCNDHDQESAHGHSHGDNPQHSTPKKHESID